ncbi:MAG TPA: TonB family protein, partial [Longimicrobiales bacterium]|nr:TonB family protein [Longimicrobiales bacterium]
MTTWMLYAVLLGLGLSLVAEMAARTLRERGRPERCVWVAALLGTALLPLALPLLPRMASAAVGTVTLPGLTVYGTAEAVGPTAVSPDRLILLLWAGAVGVLAVRLVLSARRLSRIVGRSRTLRRWPVEVRLTATTGPAVAGLRRPVILLPRSIRALERPDRHWILRHELEHLRAGDPALVWLALAVQCVLPWNPAVWFLGRRLREGLEFDCDRRVLARRPDPRSYGETLLTLVTPTHPQALPVAAFREPLLSLKRRFFAMTTPRRAFTPRALALLTALAGVALVGACEFSPIYYAEDPETAEPAGQVVAMEVERVAENPTFTPYTEAPDIVNREEVISSLEREYPALLRDAGIGGTTNVWFFINAQGELEDMRIQKSSGHDALDEAALRV